jgi:hypothetical protein
MSNRTYVPENNQDFVARYTSNSAVYDLLFDLMCQRPYRCPVCGGAKRRIIRCSTERPSWKKRMLVCCHCGTAESATTNTLLHGARFELKDWAKLCWRAVGGDGISVQRIEDGGKRGGAILLGTLRTQYRSIALLRAAMSATPKLDDSVDFGLFSLTNPKARRTAIPKLIAVVVSGRRAKLEVLPQISKTIVADFLRRSVDTSCTLRVSPEMGAPPIRLSDLNGWNPPELDSPELALQTYSRAAGVEWSLKSWLVKVGWRNINSRNLPGYLAEFCFHLAESRQGSTHGWRFIRLMRQAISIREPRPGTIACPPAAPAP